MTMPVKQSDPNTPTLSEKARRLLAAHDREVSQFDRDPVAERGAHAFRMAS